VHFNVPIGKYPKPNIISEENIMLCHQALTKADISVADYSTIKPQAGDFVYLDPTYHSDNDNPAFTQYSKTGFSDQDQLALRDFVETLDRNGVKIMLSNSNTNMITNLYKDLNLKTIDAPRYVSCKGAGRKNVQEVVITNY